MLGEVNANERNCVVQKDVYPFSRTDVNVGEEQLVTGGVLSRPVSDHLFDVGQEANER